MYKCNTVDNAKTNFKVKKVTLYTKAVYNVTIIIKGVLHPWTLFLKALCIFSKSKATLDKVSNGSD